MIGFISLSVFILYDFYIVNACENFCSVINASTFNWDCWLNLIFKGLQASNLLSSLWRVNYSAMDACSLCYNLF